MADLTRELELRFLQAEDVGVMAAAFLALGWGRDKPRSQYERYLAEQDRGEREVLVAFDPEGFAGYLTIVWDSAYPPFHDQGIPEIKDLNVLPRARRVGIATQLMNYAERMIASRSPIAGIGVGMITDYGPAQRLYVLRGYVPDGKGLVYQNRFAEYGTRIKVDDDLVLYFTKRVDSA